jgi:hypothetical protein
VLIVTSVAFLFHVYSHYLSTTFYIRTWQAVYVQSNLEAPIRKHWYRGKAISIAYPECVSLALFIQHAKRLRRIIFSCEACRAVP